MLRSVTLLALAVSPALALTIKDGDAADALNLDVKFQLQTRATLFATADNAAGESYDVLRGQDGESDAARFDIRRARLGFNARMGNWFANITTRAGEQADIDDTDTSRNPQLFYAYAGRKFVTDSGAWTHELKGGLDKVWNSESSISSATYLFPNERVTSSNFSFRAPGVAWRIAGPYLRFGVDVANNSTSNKDDQAADERNGMLASARFELSPGSAWWIPAKAESFLGKDGKGMVFGLEVTSDNAGLNDDGDGTTYTETDRTVIGGDVLFHYNNLSILVEGKWQDLNQDVNSVGGGSASTETRGFWAIAQAGYAMTQWTEAAGLLVEPALRFSYLDADTKDDDEETVLGLEGADANSSGWGLDVGVNLYFNGTHNNKLQIGLQHWEAEAGEGSSDMVRVQHQIFF